MTTKVKPSSNGLTKALFAALLIALAFLTLVRILLIVRDFTSPTELTFPNSVMAYKAREVQHGRPLYTDFRQPPHVLTLYGPLLYVVPGLIGRLIQADEVTLFYLGRVFSLLGTAGSLVIVGWMISRTARAGPLATNPAAQATVGRSAAHEGRRYFEAGTRSAATLATAGVMIVFTAPILWPVCTVFRPDPMEMFWTLLGLAIFLRCEASPWRYASVAAFLVAFLYKQSGAVGPIAVTAYLLVNRRSWDAVRYGAVSLTVFLVAVAGLNVITDGKHWLNNVVALRANVTWFNLITVTLQSAIWRCLIPFAPAILIVAWRWSRRQFDLLTVFFAIALFVAASATVRDGSADNYFLTSLAIATVIAAQEWARWQRTANSDAAQGSGNAGRGRTKGNWPVNAALIVALIFFAPRVWNDVQSIGPLRAEIAERPERDAQRLAFVREAAARLDALNGPVLCQFDPVNLYMRHAVMFDTLTFAGLADQGVFDDAAIVWSIREKQFSAVVLMFPAAQRPVPRYQSTDWFREEWVQAVAESGYHESVFGPLFIYTP